MIIEFQGPPTARMMPASARMTGASGLRISAASTAADLVREEHRLFRQAAAGVGMREHHAFHHVCAPSYAWQIASAAHNDIAVSLTS